MQAVGVILKGAIALAFLLLALWLGVMAWAEVERGWWREEAGELAAAPALSPDENGWTELAKAHAWYRAYSGGEAVALDDVEDFEPYIRDTADFIALVATAYGKPAVRIEAETRVVSELAACVQHALTARARFYAEQPRGMTEALDALHLLFSFIAMIPADSVELTEIRIRHFADAIQELRALSLRPGFPAKEARPTFSSHLLLIENDDDLHATVAAERTMRVRQIAQTLEPGARDQDWLRPAWRALLRDGEIIPLCYRESRNELTALRELDEAVGLPTVERKAAIDELPSDPVTARVGVLLDGRPGLRAAARITRLGLAAIEYHQEKGAWPMDPSALEDRFEGSMPVDPFSGQLFPFHRSEAELYLAPSQPVRSAEWTLTATP
ncbi:MAG: hypothetical protein ACYTEG_10455 [Planctomycetota bacterium]